MIDLHMHTINSDGSDTPEELLRKCEKEKLEYIAITDHDTCKSYDDLKNIDIKKIYSGKIIPGCELTTIYEGRVIEILGYNVDTDVINKWKDKYNTPELKKKRKEYTLCKIIEKVNELGIDIKREDIVFNCSADMAVYRELIKNRKENEKILGSKLLESVKNFFRLGVSNPESKLFVDTSMFHPKPQEVVDIIHKAGGKAFLAHAYQYAFPNTLEFIDKLREIVEIDGVEAFHSTFTLDQMIILQEYAKKNKLYISGGSDYHGTVKPDVSLKTGCGNLHISKNILEWIK